MTDHARAQVQDAFQGRPPLPPMVTDEDFPEFRAA